MPTFAIYSTLQSLPLQFTQPRLGLNFPYALPETTATCEAETNEKIIALFKTALVR